MWTTGTKEEADMVRVGHLCQDAPKPLELFLLKLCSSDKHSQLQIQLGVDTSSEWLPTKRQSIHILYICTDFATKCGTVGRTHFQRLRVNPACVAGRYDQHHFLHNMQVLYGHKVSYKLAAKCWVKGSMTDSDAHSWILLINYLTLLRLNSTKHYDMPSV